jgi:hypothetical protein
MSAPRTSRGPTGFAHLFEHLMFNGSENSPGDYFEPLREIGATDFNGTTWFDRTNYFQTVPRAALDRVLFLESDRMGHLLGAVTQEKLDNQRGVVQNEKRQGDNEPFGLVEYAQLEALFPEGHPYRHSTIGSMRDLDAATLDTVGGWFRENYGPNNAVLVLAGDINAAQARPLVERYFGDIPRGPVNEPAQADVPTCPARVDQTMHDRVANTRPLSQLGGGRASPMPTRCRSGRGHRARRPRQFAPRQPARPQRADRGQRHQLRPALPAGQPVRDPGRRDARPGCRRGVAPARRDCRRLHRQRPDRRRGRRTIMRTLSGRIQGLEQVGGFGGKAVALAEGALYANRSQFPIAPASSSWRA